MTNAPQAVVARVTVLNGPSEGRQYPIGGGVSNIGRSGDCAICLDLPSVSRQHAQIEERGGNFVIRDLDSRNGIAINSKPAKEGTIKSGDTIQIGDVELRFETLSQEVNTQLTRRLSGQDILAATQGSKQFQAPPVPPGAPQPEPSGKKAVGLNVKFLAVTAVALLLSVVAGGLLLKLMNSRSGPREIELAQINIRVGERRWVPVSGRVVQVSKGATARLGDWDDAVVEDERVASASRYEEGELIIEGLAGGDTYVNVLMNSGSVAKILVLVRGKLDDDVDRFALAEYSIGDRFALAERSVRAGKLIEKEQPYLALQQYNRAIALLKALPERGNLYVEAIGLQSEATKVIDARWDKLRSDLNVAYKNHDYARAQQVARDIQRLIPDPNDPRYQRTEWMLSNLVQRVKK